MEGSNHQVILRIDAEDCMRTETVINLEDPNRNDRREDVNISRNQGPSQFSNTDEDEETEESVRQVESALSRARLKDISGFQLADIWMPCCPSFKITQNLTEGLRSIGNEGWRINSESVAGCYCCLFPRARKWNTIKLTYGGREILSFIYKPQVWWPGEKVRRMVNIYIPERTKRIGWIEYDGNEFENGHTVVVDSISKSELSLTKYETNCSTIAMKISNPQGVPMAVAQSTKGYRMNYFCVAWTQFEMQCSASMTDLTSSTKAVVLVAYIMWVLQYHEHNLRVRCILTWILVVLSLIIFYLAYQ